MISIGVAQIANSLEVERNFQAILSFLEQFKKAEVDVVVFLECSLSGFSAKMKECTFDFLSPYLERIQTWSNESNIEIVLPTALVDGEKIYNSGFWFKGNIKTQFYKLGLTESEKTFFAVPDYETPKVFQLKDFKCGLLICKEVQLEPYQYIGSSEIDFILWPGYWGWTKDCRWQSSTDGKENLIFSNSLKWKNPIVQANFAFNDLGGQSGPGPEGVSMVIDSDNRLLFQGSHLSESGFIVQISKVDNNAVVTECLSLQ